jgi:putative CocE/NonD family hydrolase
MERTPYSVGPYGPAAYSGSLGPNPKFMEDRFVFVYQDVRGRFMSEGYYQYMTPNLGPQGRTPPGGGDVGARPNQPTSIYRPASMPLGAGAPGPTLGNALLGVDESTDTYDTIAWLLKHVPNNNGRVGLWGISAPGMLVTASMIDAHPALVAASPQAPMIDWYFGDDRHKHGAFTLAQTFNFLSNFARTRPGPTTSYGPFTSEGSANPDGYAFFLKGGTVRQIRDKYLQASAPFFDSIMVHPNYDDFWKKRSFGPHLNHIKPAVLWVGGWYDGEDPFGPLEAWRQMDVLSQETERYLVVGPWWHGGWARGDGDFFGLLQFGQKTAEFYRDSLEFPFFSCKLKDRCDTKVPHVAVFRTGSNSWDAYDAWPPKEAATRSIYLREGGALSFDKPAAPTAFDTYVSDPAKPVPYTNATSFGYYRFWLTEDQRFVSSRPDVLVYETEPLTEDLTIAGEIKVTLHVSTTGADADFITKVIDVYPNDAVTPQGFPYGTSHAGMQQLVRGDVMRARWRRDYAKPIPLVPNQPDSLVYPLNDVYHTFRKGHRLMVQVQSTWFPLIDRNPQTWAPNIYEARPADFRAETMRVYRSARQPSRIEVRLVNPQ